MEIRTTKPTKGNKFYTRKASGGWSACVKGNPTDACDVLANCVGYACGRFNEIIGEMKYPSLNCNAENFIERAKNTYGLTVVSYPTLGGIMVWQKGSTLKGNDGAGHVAIVERIDSANQIYTSESGYGSSAFWNSIRKNTNGRWGLGKGYIFRGCIVNPAIGDVHYVENEEPNVTGTITYQVYANGKWQSEVNKCNSLPSGYAGVKGKAISGIRCKSKYGELTIQTHIKGGKWLSAISSKDYVKSSNDGNTYSGIMGKPIDGVIIKSTKGYVTYRVHLKNSIWLDWVDSRTTTGANSYAGVLGKEIDMIQMK